MEELFATIGGNAALVLEAVGGVLIVIGSTEAIVRLLVPGTFNPKRPLENKKRVWIGLGVWLLLGLEFKLGADIIRSAISPTWMQLGQLGAIALLRTFLNYFLEKDIEKYAEPTGDDE
jgi:uncharacterized membrane protein